MKNPYNKNEPPDYYYDGEPRWLPLTNKERRVLTCSPGFWKPTGLSKLNPLAWWRYYKLKRHLVYYWPLDD